MPMSYEQARRGYLDWLGLLLEPLELNPADDFGAGEAFRLLTARLDGFNMASEELFSAVRLIFNHPEHAYRGAALDSLLHQLEGDLAVAGFIWLVIEQAAAAEGAALPDAIQSLIKNSALQITFRHLQAEMPTQIDSLAAYYRQTKPAINPTLPLPDALGMLRFEIEDAAVLIENEVVSSGTRLIRLILHNADWREVKYGIDLLQGEQKFGGIAWGLEDKVPRLARELAGELRTTLANLLTRVFIITRNNEFVRYIIEDWVQDLHDTHPDQRRERFNDLLDHLYQMDNFRINTLERWLIDAVNPECIQNAAYAIRQLGINFKRLTTQLRHLGEIAEHTPLLQQQDIRTTGYALETGLLGILIFAGFDHLDEGQNLLNITRGIKEILIQELPVAPRTLELTR